MTTTHTPALIAEASVGIRRTESTNTVDSANSQPTQRIDSFLKLCIDAASSDDFSSVKRSAQAAAQHGFTSSANSRYADFLEAFRNSQAQGARYRDAYPNCCFLGWKAFHALRRALDLWCELPEHYAGAVPDAQVPWMDIFEMSESDKPDGSAVVELLEVTRESEAYCMIYDKLLFNRDPDRDRFDPRDPFTRPFPFRSFSAAQEQDPEERYNGWFSRYRSTLPDRTAMQYGRELQNSFFVMAPKEAFLTVQAGKDWIERMRTMTEDAKKAATQPPNDPLVIRFCRDGALVVAAWGDEAAVLNDAVRRLKL